MTEAGNIAQAALSINGVFEAAQRAADQYLESVKEMVNGHFGIDGSQTIVTSSAQIGAEELALQHSIDRLRSCLSGILREDEA